MRRGGTVGSAMGALVLTALFMFRGGAPGPQPSSDQVRARGQVERPADAKKNEKATFPEEGPWRASRDHFAGPAARPEGKKTCAISLPQGHATGPGCGLRKDLWMIPEDQNVQAMIAIVPDPVHTHLALVFDRTVEALQLAAGTSNYVGDRFWLPWDTNAKPEFADYPSVRDFERDQRAKLQQPGLMMFRYDGEIGPRDKAPRPIGD